MGPGSACGKRQPAGWLSRRPAAPLPSARDMLNTVPCTPSAVAVACDAIETCTRDTADDPVYAVVVVPPDVPSSGGPTHTGVFPARADPADGAAVSACLAGTETA